MNSNMPVGFLWKSPPLILENLSNGNIILARYYSYLFVGPYFIIYL